MITLLLYIYTLIFASKCVERAQETEIRIDLISLWYNRNRTRFFLIPIFYSGCSCMCVCVHMCAHVCQVYYVFFCILLSHSIAWLRQFLRCLPRLFIYLSDVKWNLTSVFCKTFRNGSERRFLSRAAVYRRILWTYRSMFHFACLLLAAPIPQAAGDGQSGRHMIETMKGFNCMETAATCITFCAVISNSLSMIEMAVHNPIGNKTLLHELLHLSLLIVAAIADSICLFI